MVQGDAYFIDVEITNEGQTLSPPAVSLVEIALLNIVKPIRNKLVGQYFEEVS